VLALRSEVASGGRQLVAPLEVRVAGAVVLPLTVGASGVVGGIAAEVASLRVRFGRP
jgi:hypothetical protein